MTKLTKLQLEQYHKDGYVVMKGLFDAEEIGLLKKTAVEDRQLDMQSYGKNDGEGGTVRLSLWNHPGNSIYGMFARCHRVVDNAELILEDEAYHYHSKMILKDAKVGGAWAWHQDYGYWYQNGILTPNLVSVFIAVDPSIKLNGCLQVIKGSHKMGRVDHVLTGEQSGADMERVNEALKRMELVYVEMEPGDAVFFHSNTLHRSDQNKSENPRWSLICCYNAKSNDPYKDSHHPRYTPLKKVDDTMIKKVGIRRFDENESTAFLKPQDDLSTKNLQKD
ncbi:MAG: phytanoyl-CoA dioxygenase family protein [Cyclobacteriaceae bacterium]|nr:phytanoyl-CoA dioxygenase family protein [Cyclobacteriaceae bacterium]